MKVWKSIRQVGLFIGSIAFIICAINSVYENDFSKATFFLVFMFWCDWQFLEGNKK